MSTETADVPPFICPYCDTAISLPDDDRRFHACNHCGKQLDLPAQFAFLRGIAAFDEAQDANIALKQSRSRRTSAFIARENAIVDVFTEAYCSVQAALGGDLTNSQRALGVEMMVNMALLFAKRSMISGLEVNYWNLLMVEHTAQEEYDAIREKLAHSSSIFGALKRLRWRQRKRQLRRTFPKLDSSIKQVADNIAFVNPPHARRTDWKLLD